MYKYIFIIHPELRIGGCRFGTGKGRAALEGASREQGGAAREQGGAPRKHRREQRGAAQWEPDLAAPCPARAVHVMYNVLQ